MKIKRDNFKNSTDYQGRTGKATVNLDKLSLVMENMIRSYNHAELAVLREWISNAYDAHVAAGCNLPIRVTLPTALNPILIVSDSGLGMSSDFVENFYLDLGSSTKDDEDKEIGGFGQGGKSALAIAAQYTMTTIHEGLKNVYIFERSPEGGIDWKNPISNEPTDEPSGTTVQVAVDKIDEYSDVNINRVLAGWSNDDVVLSNGKKFFSIPDESTELTYEIDLTDYSQADEPNFEKDIRQEKGYVLKSAFELYSTSTLTKALKLDWNDSVVLVGPVAYVFNHGGRSGRSIKDYMVVSVNIGEVSFPASREVIESSRSNRDLVAKCFEALFEKSTGLLEARSAQLKTPKEALALLRSPLVAGRSLAKELKYQGGEIPEKFTPAAGEEIFSYERTGRYGTANNYKLTDPHINHGRSVNLEVQTLVIRDLQDVGSQSIRNNLRLWHSDRGDLPENLSGYLLISEKPNEWVEAAAKLIVKASDLADKAKEIRRAQRELAAADKAAGIDVVAGNPERKTRRERIGGYRAKHLSFTHDEEGKLKVTTVNSSLMEFHDEHFDPTKTLVLTLNKADYTPGQFTGYFEKFGVNPSDVQFLEINTGAKIETLRILLGDEVKIVDLVDWLKGNFATMAKLSVRRPSDIAAEMPLQLIDSQLDFLKEVGVEKIHPKFSEIMKLQKELNKSSKIFNLNSKGGYDYYGQSRQTTRFMEGLFDGFTAYQRSTRPEFYFLSEMRNLYRYDITEAEKPAIRRALNQMVENWLDNLALEEAEALEAEAAVEIEALAELAATN